MDFAMPYMIQVYYYLEIICPEYPNLQYVKNQLGDA